MVRFKLLVKFDVSRCDAYFNSIMVRFKPHQLQKLKSLQAQWIYYCKVTKITPEKCRYAIVIFFRCYDNPLFYMVPICQRTISLNINLEITYGFYTSTTFTENCLLTFFPFQIFACPYYIPFY